MRDPDALRETFRDADVVVHLAFLITGTASRGTTKAVNVDGTLNVFRAAGDAGVRRFVYAPSVAAYGFALPVPVPMLTMQLIHEEDVGQALLLCVVGAGPPGAYNIAGEGIVTTADIARELGAIPIPLPEASARAVARAVAAFPFLPAALEWVEAAGRPAIMDTTKARTELGWKPVYTSLEALRDTLRARPE